MTKNSVAAALAALLLVLPFGRPASAQQGDWIWDFQYSTVLGAGDTGDFAGDFSWRGVTVDVRKVMSPSLSIGLETGWHVMDEEFSGTLQLPSGAITGTSFQYVNSIPVLLTGEYQFQTGGELQPFAGAGIGTYWIENRTEAGVFAVDDSNWHFGLMGEAGIAFLRPNDTAFTFTARYNWAFETNDVERPYWTFSAGYRVVL
ncbi:MAG TPA: outer membrane beta-barrel protein [Longimicrobiales bacterium]|nr:outer membrane beta-barrel protein [Longimicrobiales bacterium]